MGAPRFLEKTHPRSAVEVAMRPLAKSASSLARVCTWVVRLHLCVFMTGCAAQRSLLSQASSPEAWPFETHLVKGDERTVFRSCIDALQSVGYRLDDSDLSEGVIYGSQVTQKRLGDIDDETQAPVKPMPGWQAGLLVLTGAALLVGGLAILGKEMKGQQTTSSAVVLDSNNLQVAAENPPLPKGIAVALALLDVASSIELPPPTVYEYDIAIQLVPMEGNTTQVRVVLDGTESQDGKELRSGPVRAPEFLDRFYSALEQSVEFQAPEPVISVHTIP
jgi:hypothetical protein